jgi:hypothetical protein
VRINNLKTTMNQAYLMNSYTTSASDMMDLCFTMFTLEDERVKHAVTAEFLHQRTSSIPRAITLSSEAINLSAKKALWFATQSVLFQSLPLNVSSKEDIGCCIHISSLLGKMCGIDVVPVNSIVNLVNKYSRDQILNMGQMMYKSARDVLVNPEMYFHIQHNETLARSVLALAFYLCNAGDFDEAQLVLGAGKLFVQNEKSKLYASTGGLMLTQENVPEHSHFMLVMESVGEVLGHTIFCNRVGSTNRKNLKKRVKKLASVIRSKFGETYPMEEATNLAVKIVSSSVVNIDDLEIFLTQLPRDDAVDPNGRTMLQLNFIQIGVILIECAYQTIQDPVDILRLHDIRVNFANAATDKCMTQLAMLSVSAGRFLNVLSFVVNVHLEQSHTLCSYHGSREQLTNSKLYLMKDSVICDSMIARHKIQSLIELRAALVERLVEHQFAIDHGVNNRLVASSGIGMGLDDNIIDFNLDHLDIDEFLADM